MPHLTTSGLSKGPELIIENKYSFGDNSKHQEIYAKHWEINTKYVKIYTII